MICSDQLSEQMYSEMKTLADERLNFLLDNKLEELYRQSKTNRIFFEKIYNIAMEIPVGKIYSTALNFIDFSQGSIRNAPKRSQLFEKAISALRVVLYFKEIESDDVEFDQQECWVKLICNHCKKHVLVKKPSTHYVNDFMNKAIMSIWMIHVFGLEPVHDNRWYQVNKSWNICTNRKGYIFNHLKTAFHMDWLSMRSDSDKVGYYQSMVNLEGLWEGIDRIFEELYQNACRIVYMLENHMHSRMGKRTIGRDYAQREKDLLECIAPKRRFLNPNDETEANKKQKNTSERQRRKREKSIQKDRHQAEHEWKNEYHADLDLQLRFKYIEYVNVDSADILNPVSEQHIVEEEQELTEKSKEAIPTDFNLNHYLMYTSETTTPYVIEDEWFQDTNEETGETIQLVSTKTLEQCQETPNKLWLLSKVDLREIKRYVNSIKVGNSLVIIRRVRVKPKDQDEEVVNFNGHISSSKYAFIGYDKKRNFHNLSQDWIDMNYKVKYPQAYKRIMKLRPGEDYKIPAGSTNENSNNKDVQTEFTKKDISPIGPMIRYMQGNRPSCLACSIASALVYINQGLYATRIMEYYDTVLKEENSEPFTMSDVLDVTT